jgi:hypothetical protein
MSNVDAITNDAPEKTQQTTPKPKSTGKAQTPDRGRKQRSPLRRGRSNQMWLFPK